MSVTSSSIFNHAVLGYIVLFFAKEKLFPRFATGATIAEIVASHGFEEQRLIAVLRLAATAGLLQREGSTYHLTPLGQDLARDRYAFTVILGGYGPLLESMDVFLAAPASSWRPYVRGDYVAIGSDEAHHQLMKATFDRVIGDLPATRIVDLGSGNAGRLVEILERRPEVTGIGIDIDPAATAVATANRDRHGLGRRLELIQEDVVKTITQPRASLQDVDLVMSFMMLHNLFNEPKLKDDLFTHMKAAFPNARYFVLADTCHDDVDSSGDPAPIFTLGFELIHLLRGIKVFPLSHYETQFAKAGLTLLRRYDLGVPHTYLFVLKA